MLTEAGCFSGESSRMNGTKKLPHEPTKLKMKTTAIPGRMRGTTIARSACIALAPSTQAASSREIGTESMKFFVMKMAIGNWVAARNSPVPHIESNRFNRTNRLYTGTIMAVIGKHVPNRTP